MSADQVVLLAVGLLLIAAVAVAVAFATSRASRAGVAAGSPEPRPAGPGGRADDPVEATTTPDPSIIGSLFVSPASTRQVARVVAFLFLASAALVVALTRAWPDNEAAIFTLLAAGTLLVVLFMDMVPPSTLGRWRRPAEGIGALVYLGLLMALTGGIGSPFLVGFFLVVAGTALSLEGLAPLLIALAAAATIALVGVAASFEAALEPLGLAWMGFAAVSLILLADIATAAARAHRRARDEALRASRFDALTGLYNRSFFFTTMEQEIRRSDRMGRAFTMLMLDLDDLKPVNDTYGHQWGDRLLKAIADVVRDTVRFTDSAARYGGDEFVVLLPETDAAGGFVVGEKLRRDIAALTLHAADRLVRSSVSVGLVSFPADGTTKEQLVAAADVAMYEAKRRGKNRIVGYQTRLERVATAIDADSAALVQLGPSSDVRTGGDPPPWAPTPQAGSPAAYGERPAGEARAQAATPRRLDRPDHVIEVDAPSAPGSPATSGRAPWSEPEPSTSEPAPGASSPSTPGGNAAPRGEASIAGAPWLTRTDTRSAPPRRTDGLSASDTTPQRPAADVMTPGETYVSGREPSRADEIRRTGERPWIVLPIEPYDPPQRPSGQGGR